MLIDSHVNLHSEKFADDLDAVIARAQEAGVGAMLTISDKLTSTDAIKAVVAANKNIWRSVGVHPHYVKEEPDLTAAQLVELAADKDVVGIGECGLDLYYEHSPRALQKQIFREHIAAARETQLPLIIHTRDADDETRSMLQEEFKIGAFAPLLHCYTGGETLAQAVIDMGGYVSFSGILTFKNAGDIRDIAVKMPLDRIIIETDCPYLAPVPMRGRRCEPAHVIYVAEKLAEVKGLGIEEVHTATTENFFRLFARAKLEEGS